MASPAWRRYRQAGIFFIPLRGADCPVLAVLRSASVCALHQLDAGLYLYCMAGSAVWQAAQRLEHPVVTEFYADREYDDQGLIVFTRSTGRLNVQAITEKVLMACLEGKVKTVTGNTIPIRFDSICIHSDTPGALEIISSVKMALINAGINVCSPGMV